MKKGLVFIVFVVIAFTGHEQAGASIVYDPTNGTTMASMLTTLEELKETTESWKSNAEFLKKVVDQGKEVKRLVSLLDGLVCSTDELEIYLEIDQSFQLCENKLELDMCLGKIDGVSEKLKLIATGAIVLSQYETIHSLKELNDELEEAIRSTSSMNHFLRERFMKRMKEEYEAENALDNTGFGTNFNVI